MASVRWRNIARLSVAWQSDAERNESEYRSARHSQQAERRERQAGGAHVVTTDQTVQQRQQRHASITTFGLSYRGRVCKGSISPTVGARQIPARRRAARRYPFGRFCPRRMG